MVLSPFALYIFVVVHTFLIGLLPFYLPVLLWEKGDGLRTMFIFIAITALGYLISMPIWDRLRAAQLWNVIIAASFLLELGVIALLIFPDVIVVEQWLLIAILNGCYLSFFWLTQRYLFHHVTTQQNTGKTFGNMQILITVVLKLGVLLGGFLLASPLDEGIFVLSCVLTGLVLYLSMASRIGQRTVRSASIRFIEPVLDMKRVLSFKDSVRSKRVFMVDGVFLYLESYFWVLTLYFFMRNNTLHLGVLVVCVSVVLAVLFYVIKNRIDRLRLPNLLGIAVAGYVLSWMLRAELFVVSEGVAYSLLLLIATLTTFFRLVFNKHFFDQAKNNEAHLYLMSKSFYSQLGLLLCFGMLALLPLHTVSVEKILEACYWIAACVAFMYLFYLKKGTNVPEKKPQEVNSL